MTKIPCFITQTYKKVGGVLSLVTKSQQVPILSVSESIVVDQFNLVQGYKFHILTSDHRLIDVSPDLLHHRDLYHNYV